MVDKTKEFLAFMQRYENKLKEDHISYFDNGGNIKTFYFQVPSSVFKPECMNEPFVLTGTDDVTLLFLVPCKFFTPGLSDKSTAALKELQDKTGMPAHLGFFDYLDYERYFENDTSETRIMRANNIVKAWVTRNIPCSGKKDHMPLEFRRIFKQWANNGRFDIVPKAVVAYIPPLDARTMELPGWITPQKDVDDSKWFYPATDLSQTLKDQGWRLRFPDASTHTVFKWAKHFQNMIETDESDATYENMKRATEAAIVLFKKEAEGPIVC